MGESNTQSIPELIRSVLQDTRDLIREEIALARAEIREEIGAARAVVLAFGLAALTAMLGVTLLCIAIGGVIASFFAWPSWVGYGIVAVLLLIAAFLLARYGRDRLARVRALPKTTQTVKENLAWIQSKSSDK
jgi:membrane protein implicated in regulation of membrane protease activity